MGLGVSCGINSPKIYVSSPPRGVTLDLLKSFSFEVGTEERVCERLFFHISSPNAQPGVCFSCCGVQQPISDGIVFVRRGTLIPRCARGGVEGYASRFI